MGYCLNRLDEPVFIQCQNLCLLSLAFIIDWRVVTSFEVVIELSDTQQRYLEDSYFKQFGYLASRGTA